MADSASVASSSSVDDLRRWVGHRLDGISGDPVGRVDGVFVDELSGLPEWVLARMGRFGHYTLVPLRDAVEGSGHVWVPYTREQMRRAPRVEPNQAITASIERSLLDHYGLVVPGRLAELERLDAEVTSARPG